MMTPHYFAVFITFAFVAFIGYGQAELFEGNACRLHDGSRGVCKNIEQCQSITDAIARSTIRFDNIVICSFLGTIQIVCCADEKPKRNRDPHTPPPNTNTDFVFEQKPSSTTAKPITTTINSYWTSWSAAQPNTLKESQIEHSHSAALIESESTTQKPNNVNSLLPWMRDILNDHSTTEYKIPIQTTTELMPSWLENVLSQHTTSSTIKSPIITHTATELPNWLRDVLDRQTSSTTTEMPEWMRDIINHHSTTKTTNPSNDFLYDRDTTTRSWNNGISYSYTTTTVRTWLPFRSTTLKSNFGDDFLNNPINGDGDGDGIEFNDLTDTDRSDGFPPRRRPTGKTKPPTPSTLAPNSNIAVRKTDAACQEYSKLPVVSGLTWQILNGVPTSPGEFPWMAAIGYESNERAGEFDYNCGGTIISEQYILTAAHCNSARAPAKTVRMGRITLFSNDDENEPLDIDIESFIKHPKYSSLTKVNDIALIRVTETIQFTEYIRPACLRTDIADVPRSQELIITGWGSTSALRTQQSTVLLKTNVTAVSLSSCNETLLEFNRLPNLPALRNGLNLGQICAYDPNAASDACQGDSGGPLQMFEQKTSSIATVVGVVSFGASCGTELPGVYTRVAFYVDWIESIVWPN